MAVLNGSIPLTVTMGGWMWEGTGPSEIWDSSFSFELSIQSELSTEYTVTSEIVLPFTVESELFAPEGIDGECSLFMPAFTVESEGNLEIRGNVSLVLPSFILGATGYDGALGNAVITLPKIILSASGYPDAIGNASLVLPKIRVDSTGNATILGNATLSIPLLLLSANGFIGEIGNANLIIPSLILSSDGYTLNVGNLNVNLPRLRISATGIINEIGNASLILPMFKLIASITPTDYASIVVNIRNRANTEYTNYSFNSLASFKGLSLGANSTGIYKLDTGNMDVDEPINWQIRTGFIDLEQHLKQKIRQAWFSYKSNGDIKVTVVLPNGESYEYDLEITNIYEDGQKVKFGKGIKSKYIQIDMQDIDGSSLDLDVIKFLYQKKGLIR